MSGASRRLLRREGSVIGGEVALRVDPTALARLSQGRTVVLVSGTNGKTTTTALLVALARQTAPVVSNSEGSNLQNGVVTALLNDSSATMAVLEVDEAALPRVLAATKPRLVVLLNLSRDQLDRVHEVRRTAASWRAALAAAPDTRVVANADDPLVVFAAEDAIVTWVAAGQKWTRDSAICAHCGARIEFAASWNCRGCGAAQPVAEYRLEGAELVGPGGDRRSLTLELPGECNRSNAAIALAAADCLGLTTDSEQAWAGLTQIMGRYSVVRSVATDYRLLLAKNPAGWAEMLDLLGASSAPLVLALNARVQDGLDTSWIWDVPFERIAGRRVVCTGDRATDLGVRLTLAGVAHQQVVALRDALASVAEHGRVDVVANYTAFQDARRILESGHAR